MVLVAQETFTPIGDIVLLQEIKPSRLTKAGLALPENVKPDQPRAKVIAVGKGRMLESGIRNELEIKAGDIVLLNGAVLGLELEGQPRLMLCSYSQIAGVIH